MPFFSVIIATYNRAQYLSICLDSLVNQTFKDFEVIIADDGSTDNTREIIKKYSKSLSIIYAHNSNWGGPAKPRNDAIKLASGMWYCFLDSDDLWMPDKLQICSNYVKNNDIIYHSLKYIGTGKPFYRTQFPASQVQKPVFSYLMQKGNCIPLSGTMVRKEIFRRTDGFYETDLSISGLEDYDQWLRIAYITDRFHYIPQNLGYYRFHGKNITENSPIQIDKIDKVFDRHAHLLNDKELKISKLTKDYTIAIIKERMRAYYEAINLYRNCLKSPFLNIKFKAALRLCNCYLKTITVRAK